MPTHPSQPAGRDPALTFPRRIGPYRLERVLGHGGMGTVYLAVRDDDHFRKHVALKLMRPELHCVELRGRFRGERQILALLNHPHIAALLDGGETESGQLYEVMEYVDGCPIDAYCREHRLAIRERLRLFLDVCAAVSHAHRYLVVHRDIKPDNVFVTTQGAVKLLDFGIAKILRPEIFDLPHHATRAAFAPCTPLYASPEQVQNLPVSTASDVYALGVLLFELLTGAMPYRATDSDMDLARAICDEDPFAPSAMARSDEERAEIEGDLDNIILMALRKEPGRRYASVDQFAADIRRHLDGFPVQARTNSARYRLSKFVRRNRVPVAAAATVAAVLATAGFATFRMAEQARSERDTARAVAQFLASVLEQNDPAQARGKELTARQALERGIDRIDRELGGKPEVQGILLHIAGRTLRHMGDVDRARSLLERSLDLRRRRFAGDHPDVAETLMELGRLNVMTGKYAEGARQLEQSVAMYRKTKGEQTYETAGAMAFLGLAYHYQWKLAEARAVLQSGLATLERLGADIGNEYYRQTLHNLTLVWEQEGSRDLAEAGMRKLLAADRKQLGEHPDVVLSLSSLGFYLVKGGKAAEAEPLLREALAMHRRVFPDGPVTLGHVQQYLAMCLQRISKFEEAEALWKETIAIHTRYLGENNRFVATDWLEYGGLERRRGRLAEAERLVRKGLAIRLQVYGPEHLVTSQAHSHLGYVYSDGGNHREAANHFREALRIRRAKMPKDRESLRKAIDDLAGALEAMGNAADARPLREESRKIEAAKPVISARLGKSDN